MPPCLAEAALSKQPRPPGTGWHARDFVSRAWSAAEVMPAEDTPRIGTAGALHAWHPPGTRAPFGARKDPATKVGHAGKPDLQGSGQRKKPARTGPGGRLGAGFLNPGRRCDRLGFRQLTGRGHPLCGTYVSLYRIHFHRYWTGVRFRLVEISEVSAALTAPVGLPILCHK